MARQVAVAHGVRGMSGYEITRVGQDYHLTETDLSGTMCAVVFRTREDARTFLFRRMVMLTDEELEECLSREEDWIDY